ncbi:hypothetical protein EUTSA_v10029298mg, partial [Eutrema salsugineum]
ERNSMYGASTLNWPALSVGNQPRHQKNLMAPSRVSKNLESDEVLKACSRKYPWAAKMDQSLRNLNRVTMPEFMEDGTPLGLENQKEFVVGQFYRCAAPSGGLVHAVVNRIWGRKCRIFSRKEGESSYLFHIPDEATRKCILQRGLWHVDDCLMFVSACQLYSIKGIKWIASGIGEPMLTSRPWLDPTQMGEAKILVEVKLDKPFPQRVALEESCETITMVDVSRCLGIGKEKVDMAVVSNPISNDTCSLPIARDAIAPKETVSTLETRSQSNILLGHESVIPVSKIAAIPAVKGTPTSASRFSSPPVGTGPIINKNSTILASTTEVTNSEQVVSPSIPSVGLRKTLSSGALGKNRFASLESSDEDSLEEEDNSVTNDDPDPEILTPSGKRNLRDRPVKPPAKAKECSGTLSQLVVATAIEVTEEVVANRATEDALLMNRSGKSVLSNLLYLS